MAGRVRTRDQVGWQVDGDGGLARLLPRLPAGYEAQPAGGFCHPAGRPVYELHLVYRRAVEHPVRGPTMALDERLSYWIESWPTIAAQDVPRANRWLRFADAHVTFGHFSSPEHMRDELMPTPAESHAGGQS